MPRRQHQQMLETPELGEGPCQNKIGAGLVADVSRFAAKSCICWEFHKLVAPNLVVCKFYTEALLRAPLHPFAPFCAHLSTCVCAYLRP